MLLISKGIGKPTHDQTQDYLKRNKLFYIYQLAIRANHCTDTCLFLLTDLILNGAENGKHTGATLIDLQKAFDTIDIKFLLEKMKCIGFSNKTIKCFYFYLTNRAFFVSLDDVFSKTATLNCRVPKPSTFIVFTLYK